MKQYHVNFYLDSTAAGASSGANYIGKGSSEAQLAMHALAQWEQAFPVETHPNIQLISMRVIE